MAGIFDLIEQLMGGGNNSSRAPRPVNSTKAWYPATGAARRGSNAGGSLGIGTTPAGGFSGAGSSSPIGRAAPSRSHNATRAFLNGGLDGTTNAIRNASRRLSRMGQAQKDFFDGGLGRIGENGPSGGVGAGGSMFPDYASMMRDFSESLQSVETPDAEAMTSRMFDPQYELLNQLRTQTTGRYNQAGQDVQAMYNSLAESMRNNQGTVAKQYGTTAQNLDAAFQGASDNINQAAQSSNSDIAATMKQLGVEEAAPDALANIAQVQAQGQNNVAGIQASFGGANEALKQSQMDYMTNSADTTGIAGANAKADVMSQLEQMLAGYGNKELELKSAEGATLNDYLMQIAGMQQDSSSAAQASFADVIAEQAQMDRWQAEQAESTRRWESENELDRARADFDVSKWETEQRNSADGQAKEPDWKNNATGQINHLASQYFPNNPQLAGAAANGIVQAFAQNPEWRSASEFVGFVNRRFPGNPNQAQYAALAMSLAQAAGLK